MNSTYATELRGSRWHDQQWHGWSVDSRRWGWVVPLPFRCPSTVLLVLYGCSAVGLGLALVGVLVDGAIRLWWAGFVVVALSGIATQFVRWRSRRAYGGDGVD